MQLTHRQAVPTLHFKARPESGTHISSLSLYKPCLLFNVTNGYTSLLKLILLIQEISLYNYFPLFVHIFLNHTGNQDFMEMPGSHVSVVSFSHHFIF